MFRSITCIAIASIFFFTALVWQLQLKETEEDLPAYETMVAQSIDLRSKTALEQAPLCQVREQVRKELWLFQKQERKHILLNILSSDLILSQKKTKIEALENWAGIQGTPLVSADRGQLDLRASSLFLEGTVGLAAPLKDKQSFALADFATFYWDEPRLLLESLAPKRVLFWQEGLQISAPKIQIRDAIEGLGDVRLAMDSEEIYRMHQFEELLPGRKEPPLSEKERQKMYKFE